jgi:DNA-directed RNA polymerase specialized sigma24 family protein
MRHDEPGTTELANAAFNNSEARLNLLDHVKTTRRQRLIAFAKTFIAKYPQLSLDSDDVLNGLLFAVYDGYRRSQFDTQPNSESFDKLLRGIIRNIVRDEAKRSRAIKRSAKLEEITPAENIPNTGPTEQEIIELFDVVEMCYADIAACEGISEPVRVALTHLFTLRLTCSNGGKPCSVPEIATIMGISKSRVRLLLKTLGEVLRSRKEDLNG